MYQGKTKNKKDENKEICIIKFSQHLNLKNIKRI
jgi:hypothetical protein